MDPRAAYCAETIRQYSSHIYYFGQQVGAELLTRGGTISLTVGEEYTIQCIAIGSPSPEVWILTNFGSSLFNNDDGEDDPYLSSLQFRPLTMQDAGDYYCYARNTLVNPPVGKRVASDLVKITLEVHNPTIPPDLEVVCVTYADNICAPFIYGEINIYVNSSIANQELVKDGFRAIEAIPGQPDGNQLAQCTVLAKAMVCHSVFPYCDPWSFTHGRVVPRPICERTCAIFLDGGECANIIDSPELLELLLSRCGLEDEAGNLPECHPISLEAPVKTEHEQLKETRSCVSSNGQGYMGDCNITASGKDCQHWGWNSPHTHPMSEILFPQELRNAGNACRNPGGLGEQPWCYTTDLSTRWEYCDIPKCDINECDTDNGGCNQTCNNTIGSFVCSCDLGYELNEDGLGCNDIDECDRDLDDCDVNATCMNTVGSYDCMCIAGFEGSGFAQDCSNINECARGSDNCGMYADCTDITGTFLCTCLEGFKGDGIICAENSAPACTKSNGYLVAVIFVSVLGVFICA